MNRCKKRWEKLNRAVIEMLVFSFRISSSLSFESFGAHRWNKRKHVLDRKWSTADDEMKVFVETVDENKDKKKWEMTKILL